MIKTDIKVRDPYVLVHEGKYYLYGTRVDTCWGLADGFDVYISEDLINWSEAKEVFHNDGSFWADRNYWAPEVHLYKGEFYMFASFYSTDRRRGTQILKAESPEGPFLPISEGPVTPKEWECLDGTLYVDKSGRPYIVFCHEWVQVGDGEMCEMELSKDLTQAVSKPRLLFTAKSALWPIENEGPGKYVTDGPFFYRCKNGELIMLWSSHGKDGYAQAIARSHNGEINGNWTQDEELLFSKDGGHGMVFEGFDKKLYLTIHMPNDTPNERAAFFQLEEENGSLRVKTM